MDLVINNDFSNWSTLNDTIMGGSSQAICKMNPNGLLFEGNLVEEGGGFASCRSAVFAKPLNLSKFQGIEIEIEGEGRTLKISISCAKLNLDFSRFFYPRLKWIAPLNTNEKGISKIKIPFNKLIPVVRAKPLNVPFKFNSSCINQFQLLHSKFGPPGQFNSNFVSGSFKIVIRSIKAYE